MTAEIHAAQALTRFLGLLKNLHENRDDLLALGSLKQAIADAQARHAGIMEVQNAATQCATEATAAAERAKLEADEVVKAARAEAERVVSAARSCAEELVAGAKMEADQLRAAALAAKNDAMTLKARMAAAFAAVEATAT